MFRMILCFLCLLAPVFCAEVLKDELREQSILYAVAVVSEDDVFGDTICRKHLKTFVEAVDSKEFWALRMLDASGQQESGYLFGHTLWLGSFSQCRDIATKRGLIVSKEQHLSKNAFPPFKTEFMTAALNHNNTMQIQFRIPINEYIHLGLCMPKSCTPDELKIFLEAMLERKYLNLQHIYPVHLNVSGVKSLRFDKVNWMEDSMVQTTLIIFLITLMLCTIGTWYDLFIYQPFLKMKHDLIIDEKMSSNKEVPLKTFQQPSSLGSFLLCYSIYTNTRTIFTVASRPDPNSGTLLFIHGIKALFMLYIVLLHGVLYQNVFTDNALTAYRLAAMMVNQVLSNSSYSVDTYFCLGGFLISYIFYKSQKDRRPYKLFEGIKLYSTMIVHRYIRLTPAYAATVLISYTLWRKVSQEYPLVHRVPLERVKTACSKYWWRNLLYINTLYPRVDMCLSWSWYLSNDMQFYVLNCMLLLVSTAYLNPILIILGLLPAISIVTGGVTSYIHKYVPTLEEQILQLEIMYDPFLIRMGPYFVGVLAGYYINKWNNTIPLSKSTISKISYTACLTAVLIIHGVYTRDNLPIGYIAVYMGVSRTLWGIIIAWLIMTCISGNAGFVNTFLSLRAWVPASRLTYCLYLVHPIIIVMFGFTGDRGIHMSYVFTIQSAVGTFAISFFAALIVSLLFESPYVLLLKLVLGKHSQKKEIN